MKIKYSQYGGFLLEASQEKAIFDADGRDMIFLKEFICNIPKEDRKILSKYIKIDMVSGAYLEENRKATECSIEQVIDQKAEKEENITTTWDDIISIEFDPKGDFEPY